jgi:peptidoglycan/LPS O-acetylase OafA/YrhL
MQFFLADIRRICFNLGMLDPAFVNLYGLMVCLLLPAVLGDGLPRILLSSKPFKFVGDRSYSLYLIQIAASEAALGFAPMREWGFEAMLVVMAFGLLMADVLYRYVETPMIRVGRKAEVATSRLFARFTTRMTAIGERV